MIAVVVASSPVFPAWIYLAVWLLVFVAAVAVYRAGERRIAALILAGLLMSGAQIVAHANEGDGDIVFVNPCDRYTPYDWQWYALGCFWPL